MSEGLETAGSTRDSLDRVTRALVAQAVVLDEMFYRAASEAFSVGEDRSYYHARKALKAQAKCHATLKVLLSLRAAACRAEAQFCAKAGTARKISNFDGGSIQELETSVLPMPYPGCGTPVPRLRPKGLSRPTGDSICRKARWTPERRARQALAIRTWQPWRTSTGPKTQDGKARSARNALKHGLRSRATIEARREDRRVFARAAHNLAIARSFGIISDNFERPIPHPFHSIGIGPVTPALIPSRPRITPGIAARRHPPPVDKASPRRGWRIAS